MHNKIRYHKWWINYLERSLKFHKDQLAKARRSYKLYK